MPTESHGMDVPVPARTRNSGRLTPSEFNLVTILHGSVTDQRRQDTERAGSPRRVSSQLRRGHLRKKNAPFTPFASYQLL